MNLRGKRGKDSNAVWFVTAATEWESLALFKDVGKRKKVVEKPC